MVYNFGGYTRIYIVSRSENCIWALVSRVVLGVRVCLCCVCVLRKTLSWVKLLLSLLPVSSFIAVFVVVAATDNGICADSCFRKKVENKKNCEFCVKATPEVAENTPSSHERKRWLLQIIIILFEYLSACVCHFAEIKEWCTKYIS